MSENLHNALFEDLTVQTWPVEHSDDSVALQGDSVEVLKGIRSKSVDLIFADPPYGIGKDFGTSKDRFESPKTYLSWCALWIEECMRLLKDNGTMYVMTSTQFMPHIDVFVSDKYHVLNRIVWHYDSSGVQAKTRFGSLYEPILMFTHSSKSTPIFNAKDILVEAKTGAKRKLIDYRKSPPAPYSTKKVPGNVWYIPRVRYKMPEYENHPTQKPEKLLERIILTSSNPDDIVLDPFSGSFTTSAAAIKLGRRAVGIDENPEFFKIGLRRTGIATEYNGEFLKRDTSRKTKNRSKASR